MEDCFEENMYDMNIENTEYGENNTNIEQIIVCQCLLALKLINSNLQFLNFNAFAISIAPYPQSSYVMNSTLLDNLICRILAYLLLIWPHITNFITFKI